MGQNFLNVDSIYIAGFLKLHRVQPKLVREQGGHVTFQFPASDQVCRLIALFNVQNPSTPVRDFSSAIQTLRAQMIRLKQSG